MIMNILKEADRTFGSFQINLTAVLIILGKLIDKGIGLFRKLKKRLFIKFGTTMHSV